MSAVTKQNCLQNSASRRLQQCAPVEKINKAQDIVSGIGDDLNDWGGLGEWFHLQPPPFEPAPLDDSFSPYQRWRKRLPEETRQIRFSVSLWATVDVRKDVARQVAAQLRKMSRFLNVQAEAVIEEAANRKAVKP